MPPITQVRSQDSEQSPAKNFSDSENKEPLHELKAQISAGNADAVSELQIEEELTKNVSVTLPETEPENSNNCPQIAIHNEPSKEAVNKALHSKEYYEEYIKIFVPSRKKKTFYRFAKRFVDIIVSLFALLVLSPVMLACVIAIKLDSKGPAIFCQKRVGKGGKLFNFYKFRSMYVTAPKECPASLLTNPEQHITKVGRFLRKSSLDELPQFFCSLVGTMSIIGPRPLVVTEEKCNKMREELGVFSVRPGISGYAQVHGRDEVYYKDKAILDAEYVKKASLWLDLKIAFKTVIVIFKGNTKKNFSRLNKSKGDMQ